MSVLLRNKEKQKVPKRAERVILFEDEKTLEAVSVEIHQTRKKLNQEKICSPKIRAKKAKLEAIYKKDNPGHEF